MTRVRPSRNRYWGHPQLIRFIERFATNASKVGWNGLLVRDMAQPRGGQMLSDHTSHQIGLDADIWFAPMPDHAQSREEREFAPGHRAGRARSARDRQLDRFGWRSLHADRLALLRSLAEGAATWQ